MKTYYYWYYIVVLTLLLEHLKDIACHNLMGKQLAKRSQNIFLLAGVGYQEPVRI